MGLLGSVGGLVRRTWAAAAVGLAAGGLFEVLMIKSRYYEHAVKARAHQVNMEWDQLRGRLLRD